MQSACGSARSERQQGRAAGGQAVAARAPHPPTWDTRRPPATPSPPAPPAQLRGGEPDLEDANACAAVAQQEVQVSGERGAGRGQQQSRPMHPPHWVTCAPHGGRQAHAPRRAAAAWTHLLCCCALWVRDLCSRQGQLFPQQGSLRQQPGRRGVAPMLHRDSSPCPVHGCAPYRAVSLLLATPRPWLRRPAPCLRLLLLVTAREMGASMGKSVRERGAGDREGQPSLDPRAGWRAARRSPPRARGA